MGLDDLYPFEPKKKIIEYILEDDSSIKLINMSLTDFINETASESPAPGGGSISAYMGSMGAALGSMVANLSSHKRGWDERWEEFSEWAEKGKYFHDELLKMVDEDTNAFNKIMDAFSLPKKTAHDIEFRKSAVQKATKYATEVPFKVMNLCYESMKIAKAMADIGNPNSVTDAGVAAISACAGVRGAFLNVKINAKGLVDKDFAQKIISESTEIQAKAILLEKEILKIVDSKL